MALCAVPQNADDLSLRLRFDIHKPRAHAFACPHGKTRIRSPHEIKQGVAANIAENRFYLSLPAHAAEQKTCQTVRTARTNHGRTGHRH